MNYPYVASQPQSSDQRRLSGLDSLRGLFAFIVVVHHFILALVPGSASLLAVLRDTPAAAFMAGRAPVIVFFVLSGFVLMLPFVRGSDQPYGIYALRRVIRIYIPFACSILLAAGLYKLSSPREIGALTAWFNEASWDAPPHPLVILKHLAMTGRWEDMRLNPVMWSLVHELRISLVFPLIAVLVRRSQSTALAVACTLYAAGFYGGLAAESAIITSLLDTVRFTAFFIVGAIMAVRLPALKSWAAALGPVGFTAALGGVICLFSLKPGFIAEMLFAGAAVGAIALAAGAPAAQQVLRLPPLRWLGRVSYTLYLVHMPVMLAVFHMTAGHLAPTEGAVLAALCILLASELFYRVFEKPSHSLARAFGGTKARQAPTTRFSRNM